MCECVCVCEREREIRLLDLAVHAGDNLDVDHVPLRRTLRKALAFSCVCVCVCVCLCVLCVCVFLRACWGSGVGVRVQDLG